MPFDVVVKLDRIGAAGFVKSLGNLEPRIQRKLIRQTMRRGARQFEKGIKDRVPVQSGALRDGIKVKPIRRSRKRIGLQATYGEPYKGDFFYAAMVEFGFFHGTRPERSSNRNLAASRRRWVPARPFMRPAFEALKHSVMAMMVKDIKAAADKAAKLKPLA